MTKNELLKKQFGIEIYRAWMKTYIKKIYDLDSIHVVLAKALNNSLLDFENGKSEIVDVFETIDSYHKRASKNILGK